MAGEDPLSQLEAAFTTFCVRTRGAADPERPQLELGSDDVRRFVARLPSQGPLSRAQVCAHLAQMGVEVAWPVHRSATQPRGLDSLSAWAAGEAWRLTVKHISIQGELVADAVVRAADPGRVEALRQEMERAASGAAGARAVARAADLVGWIRHFEDRKAEALSNLRGSRRLVGLVVDWLMGCTPTEYPVHVGEIAAAAYVGMDRDPHEAAEFGRRFALLREPDKRSKAARAGGVGAGGVGAGASGI